jgi:hypothetical protein
MRESEGVISSGVVGRVSSGVGRVERLSDVGLRGLGSSVGMMVEPFVCESMGVLISNVGLLTEMSC